MTSSSRPPGARRSGLRAARWAVLALVVIAAGVAGCADDVVEPGADPAEVGAAGTMRGAVRTPPPEVGDLTLPDISRDGAAMDLRAEPDGILLVYFGYTSCPDVCPTTLAVTKAALRRLGDEATRVSLAMVTVDPERDTDAILSAYVDGFIEGSHALRTTDPAQLRQVADGFGATYTVTKGPDGAVEVTHSGSIYAVDDSGHVVVQWPFGTDAADIAADLGLLLGAN